MYSKILITGCGGDIGFGIAKILRMLKISKNIIGCDIHSDHAGKYVFDSCEIIDRVDSVNYLDKLQDLIKHENIDLIIPSSELELRFFHENNIRNVSNATVIMPNNKAMEIGFDKLLTANFLKENGLPFPITKPVKDGLPDELPCILKSRTGCGSKNISIVDENSVEYFSKTRQDDIWQELLLPDNQEYTCGVYGLNNGEIRTIILKRSLLGGLTGKGQVVYNKSIEDVLIKLAQNLNLRGSINVQLRLTKKAPVIFEINPRFSSTIVFRHILGFQDVYWSLLENAGLPVNDYIQPEEGKKFYRVSEEVFL